MHRKQRMKERTSFMFIHIFAFTVINGENVSTPSISPSGTVDIVQGMNLTLNCTYQTNKTVHQLIAWNQLKQNGTSFASHLSIYDAPGSTCAYFDGNVSKYGYSCPADNQFNIIIYNVQRISSQGSTWMCSHQVGSFPNVFSTTVILNVQVPVRSVTLSPDLGNLSVIEGRGRQFECKTSPGEPAPRVQWFKFSDTNATNINITSLSISSLSTAGTSSVLTLVLTRYDHGLRIKCSAENVGSAKIESATKPLIDVLYGPSVTEITDQQIVKGRAFTYNCSVTVGNPAELTFIWTRNGSNETWHNQQLYLPSVQRKDDAIYYCTATNELNPTDEPNQNKTDYKSFHLDVLFGAENIVFYLEQYQESSSFNVTESSTVTLKCLLDSNPGSTIVISKDGNNKHTVLDTKSLSYSIDGKCDDAGVYTCSGSNQYAGRLSKDIDIHILCTPRAAPNVHISYNVSSVRDANVTLSFTALAFPPLQQSSFLWQKCTISGCEPVLRDKTVVSFSTSGFGNRLGECNLTIVNVREDDYTEYQMTVNGISDKKWRFFLNALDKPQPPTDFMVIVDYVTKTSANATWLSGYNGGLPQTFQLQIRESGDSKWTIHYIQENSTINTGNMYFVVNGLQSGFEYEMKLFAFNAIGNTSSVHITFSTLNHMVSVSSSSPNVASVAGGIIAGIVGILITVLCVVLRRYKIKCFLKHDLLDKVVYDTAERTNINNGVYDELQNVNTNGLSECSVSFYNELGKAYESLDCSLR
ncbi:nephrin-like [Dreissena polymorpha]|uniref:nephrin-like n=1 Tax=Dreissena polymorpha TaxID=45954 RepID=UPI002263C641|nr:nephrin-like [Dreissena polymorpha]